MNGFDTSILHFLNLFATKSWLFDEVICFIGQSPLRGVLFIATLWWVWFRQSKTESRDRTLIISGLAFSVVALLVARGLAFCLPFRQRPLANPALHFQRPYGFKLGDLLNWSSFPSDHAVFYFAIATTMFLVSRKFGILAYLYSFFVVCLPRVYMGIHYPTDVLAGAILGIGIGSLASIAPLGEWLARRPMRMSQQAPGVFYAAVFVTTYLFSTNFDPVREPVGNAWHRLSEARQAHHKPQNSVAQGSVEPTLKQSN